MCSWLSLRGAHMYKGTFSYVTVQIFFRYLRSVHAPTRLRTLPKQNVKHQRTGHAPTRLRMRHAQSGQGVRSSHMPEAILLILRNYRKMFNMSTLRTTVFKILLINVVIHVVGIQCETAVIRKTKYGSVLGRLTSLSQKFLGVPFAAPTERYA